MSKITKEKKNYIGLCSNTDHINVRESFRHDVLLANVAVQVVAIL